MKAKDLMIGDYVIRKNVPKEILIVDAIDSIRNIVYLDLDGLGITEKIENIEPIPLTAEILEKNGFELYEQDFTSDKVYLFDKGFTYIEDCGNYFVIGANVEYEHFGRKLRFISSTIKVYYVHELQHALRLCGINKEIKL